ncbi:hypothetical protein [Alkalihalobacillus deserti]|uniref:hypothetical protein n=1 Tax=Alkalihalobacillus deserti TaxID=2879466 RepID=UPI001D139A75|nr:hypothetical protein [Alkalihalobacillus deserti]
METEISTSKKLIREYINQYKRRGFIEWRDVGQAVVGAEMTLEEAHRKMIAGDTESAVLLCKAVLSIVVDMLQYCDDSSGIVGGVIEGSLEIMDESVSMGMYQLSDREQRKIFSTILKEAQNKRYDGWSDWSVRLLRICISFSNNPVLRAKLEEHLNSMLENLPDSSWSSDYHRKELKRLQLEMIERYDTKEKAQEFITANIKYSTFREMAIASHMEAGEFSDVIRLCNEGEKLNKEYPGLVRSWKKYRFLACEALGDIEGQRKLALDLLNNGDFDYYSKLKGLYQPIEWSEVLEEILTTFEKQTYPPSAYLEIIKTENMKGKLLQYCERHLSSIEDLYPFLIEEHLEEVIELFKTLIKAEAARASNRKQYKKVGYLIQRFQKVCGDIQAQKVINSLIQQYINRPAFVDELGKLV